ncbi:MULTISPECIES: multicopper oxidase family protein [unclassified Ruegeria]|uniref:multicopper oxidase family protein n=1 Tax=unclassified Ruegeria TaxID=2625375 RepID=UPI001AD95324|nr:MULTISPECIES: multicopper oxidase family protein [unclassified Ruegeria]MBO9413715.1 multicopper oxidase family protein [Ruegeria sp. R8_1]MBO9417678.1 multicopper oxidase family protein [Ruegeria sp. R8_2]
MNRREFFLSSGAAAGAFSLGGFGLAASPQELVVQPARFALREQVTDGMVSLSPDAPPPVLHGKQGEVMRLPVRNTLPDYTAMHWHGLRIPNGMDGVPYLTQMPIGPDEVFAYEFTPPDAGTYWYHPHCMTMEQMAHGLTGVMVIAEAEDPGFDSEQVVNLRDFRLDEDGAFLPAYTARGAARAGTFGNVQTANWLQSPVYDHAAGGLVRMRVVNTDTTRIYKLHLSSSKARIIAWDGHPVEIDLPLPGADAPLLLGPGQRVDFAVQMPATEGQTVDLIAKFPGQPPRSMSQLRAIGRNMARDLRGLRPLPMNPVAKPDLDRSELHEFVFGWTPEGGEPINGFCGSLGYNFWSINRTPWPGDAAPGVGPLATLEQGKSYVLRLRNESPNLHPIHLHGLAFVPLTSNLRTLPPLVTDTMLLLKDETVDIALVADNVGDWAFHCHVIEHQKTGLTGFIRVV